MKKLLFFSTILFFGLTACSDAQNVTEQGVVIDGIRWATRNVDAPGTFAKNPEDAGMIFQFNRRNGWNATCEKVENWDNSRAPGTMWYAENDPCPEGWRVPTFAEIQSLYNSGNEWAERNGVYGRLFGVYPHQIFLPAVGLRRGASGEHDRAGWSYVWSSTAYDNERGMRMWVGYDTSSLAASDRANGFSVRCVAKE